MRFLVALPFFSLLLLLLLLFLFLLLGWWWWWWWWWRFPMVSKPPFVRLPRRQPCQSDGDCRGGDAASSSSSSCYRGECHPRPGGGEEEVCDPARGGVWTLMAAAGSNEPFVGCLCEKPHLVRQSVVGGPCDRDRVCQSKKDDDPEEEEEEEEESFRLLSGLQACDCPNASVSRIDPLDGTPRCVPLTIAERIEAAAAAAAAAADSTPCLEDEIDLTAAAAAAAVRPGLVSPSYAARFPGLRCTKRPCSFDALTHKPLTHTFFEPGWGCVCDPRWGNVGVRLENHPDYLPDVPGPNACIRVFKEEERPRAVELYTYFYVYGKQPIAFVHFLEKNITSPDQMAEPFRRSGWFGGGGTGLQVEEHWPYDYGQYILNHSLFLTRTKAERRCVGRACWSNELEDTEVRACRDLVPIRKNHHRFKNLLRYPFCRVLPGDGISSSFYDHRVVSNPLFHKYREQILNAGGKADQISNGLRFREYETMGSIQWIVDAAPTLPDFMNGVVVDELPLAE